MIIWNLFISLYNYVTPYLVSCDCDDTSEYHQYSKHHFSSVAFPCISTCMHCVASLRACVVWFVHASSYCWIKINFIKYQTSDSFSDSKFFAELKLYFIKHQTSAPSSYSYSHKYSTSNKTVKLSKHFSLSARNICCFTILTQDSLWWVLIFKFVGP